MNALKKWPVVVFALCLALPGWAQPPQREQERECVILLHGLWRSGLSMKFVEWHLQKFDYAIVNVSYPSLLYSIEELAVIAIEKGLHGCADNDTGTINLVTHSLGGILVRQYLSHTDISGLKRVVMLAPPNQGSQVADYLQTSWSAIRLLEPQAALQLGTGTESIPSGLGPVSFELGIIAGTVNRRGLLPGTPEEVSDGTVSTAETVVQGMLDYIELPVSHTSILWNGDVLSQTAFFLQHGRFDKAHTKAGPVLLGKP